MASVWSLFSGGLLAAPAGLNPYLPLLFAAVMARYTDRFQPRSPYGFIGQTWFVVLAGLLFLAHIFLDKMFVPGDSLSTVPSERDGRLWVGTLHDLGLTILGPASGALLMGAVERAFSAPWVLVGPMLGALLAALAYVGKRTLRHRLSDRFGPFSNLLLSAMEDALVAVLCLGGVLLSPTVGAA
jgi:hypothetical protein